MNGWHSRRPLALALLPLPRSVASALAARARHDLFRLTLRAYQHGRSNTAAPPSPRRAPTSGTAAAAATAAYAAAAAAVASDAAAAAAATTSSTAAAPATAAATFRSRGRRTTASRQSPSHAPFPDPPPLLGILGVRDSDVQGRGCLLGRLLPRGFVTDTAPLPPFQQRLADEADHLARIEVARHDHRPRLPDRNGVLLLTGVCVRPTSAATTG